MAIQLNPGNANLYRIRAEAYKNNSNSGQALVDIDHAILLDGADWTYHSLRGRINHDLANLPDALDNYAKAIILLLDNPDTYFNRSLVYLDLEIYDKAMDDFNTIISLDVTYADAYFNRGILHWGFSDLVNARDDLSKAVELYQNQGFEDKAKAAQNIQDEINNQ